MLRQYCSVICSQHSSAQVRRLFRLQSPCHNRLIPAGLMHLSARRVESCACYGICWCTETIRKYACITLRINTRGRKGMSIAKERYYNVYNALPCLRPLVENRPYKKYRAHARIHNRFQPPINRRNSEAHVKANELLYLSRNCSLPCHQLLYKLLASPQGPSIHKKDSSPKADQ